MDLLICLACSLTLNLASTMEEEVADEDDEGDPAFVDFARAKDDKVAFVVLFTQRIFEAGRAIIVAK